MSSVLSRTLNLLELLSRQSQGMELAEIARQLNMPKSAAHRMLTELVEYGYVKQLGDYGQYLLTTKLVALGLSYLSKTGIVDIAQPLLDSLAAKTGELVRLAVIDGNRLTWVARSQGAKSGLRYDPDMGGDARLSCSSSGWAWLSTLTDEQAVFIVAQQGIGKAGEYGPNAPETIQQLLERLQETRQRGYALTEETYAAGLNAMAAPVRLTGQLTMGTLSIAGPSSRMPAARLQELGSELLASAAQLAAASGASHMLSRGNAAAHMRPIYAE